MLMLILFKLLLKTMRLLCDKNMNHLNLNNWKEYQQCKLYQQLYSELTGCSEKYEKDYLEFIRYNDIRVIRAVNRKFPELCTNNPLSGRFHENFREFLGTVIRKHDNEVSNLIQQGEQDISDRFEALNSLYSVYKLTEIRSSAPKSTLLGEKPTLLENYSESKLTRSDYSNLKRRVKHICP